MKTSSALLITGIVLAASAGGIYFIYTRIQKGKQDNPTGDSGADLDEAILNVINNGGTITNVTPTNNAQTAYAALPQGSFPLYKGQKSKYAWIVQAYLNCAHNAGLAVDGAFGPKSETALLKFYGVKGINNFPHLYQLVATKGDAVAACAAVANQRLSNAQAVNKALGGS